MMYRAPVGAKNESFDDAKEDAKEDSHDDGDDDELSGDRCL